MSNKNLDNDFIVIRPDFCNTVNYFMPLSLDPDSKIQEDSTVSPVVVMFFYWQS